LFDITGVSVWLLEGDADELVCRAAAGPESEVVHGWRLPMGEGIVGVVARDLEAVIVPDVTEDDRHFTGVDVRTGLPLRSVLVVPMLVGEHPIGVLQLVDTQCDRFSPEDLEFMAPLAASAAIAIENACLHEKAQAEIAERRRTENALRESEEHFRVIFESSNDLVVIADEGGRAVWANPSWRRLLGCGLGMRIDPAKWVHGDDRERARTLWATMRDEGVPFTNVELRAKTTAKDYVCLEVTARNLLVCGRPMLCLVAHDISERKRMEEALRSSEGKWRSLVENVPDVITTLRRDGMILFQNQSLLGRDPEELFGKCIYDLFAHECEDDLRAAIETVFREGRTTDCELRGRDANAGMWYRSRIGAVLRDGQVVAATMISTDVTEQKEAEERTSASLREKVVLLQEIHHRVKNNLQVISSLLDLQSQQLKDEAGAPRAAFMASKDRVLAMARVYEQLYKSDDLARIHMAPYVGELVQHLGDSYGGAGIQTVVHALDVVLEIDAAVPCGLVINELASNAFKHAFPGKRQGTLQVGVKRTAEDTCELTVSDDGIGISEELDPARATSLGLRLVSLLTRQLRGQLVLERGTGTTFKITFPLE